MHELTQITFQKSRTGFYLRVCMDRYSVRLEIMWAVSYISELQHWFRRVVSRWPRSCALAYQGDWSKFETYTSCELCRPHRNNICAGIMAEPEHSRSWNNADGSMNNFLSWFLPFKCKRNYILILTWKRDWKMPVTSTKVNKGYDNLDGERSLFRQQKYHNSCSHEMSELHTTFVYM